MTKYFLKRKWNIPEVTMLTKVAASSKQERPKTKGFLRTVMQRRVNRSLRSSQLETSRRKIKASLTNHLYFRAFYFYDDII